MESLTFKIKGITPLLCHNPASMLFKNKKLSRKPIEYNPQEDAEKATYRLPDGTLVFPSIGVRSSMLEGAKGLRSGKYYVTSLISHIIVESLDSDPEWLKIYDSNWELVKDYEIDSRRAVVQGQGVVRSRPKFSDWALEFKVVYDESVITGSNHEDFFKDVIRPAGIKAGLGDYRPACKGWFGRYKIYQSIRRR